MPKIDCAFAGQFNDAPQKCVCPNHEVVVLEKGFIDCSHPYFDCMYSTWKNIICMPKCSSKKPVRDSDGRCRSCDDVNVFRPNNIKDNKACPNRIMVSFESVLNCSREKPLLTEDFSCLPCDHDRIFIKVFNDGCGACSNRRLNGEYCVLKMKKVQENQYDVIERVLKKRH